MPSSQFPSYHRYAIPCFQPSVNQSSHPACKRKPEAHTGLIILFQVSLTKGTGPRMQVVLAEPSIEVSLPLLSGWNMGSSFPLDKNSRGVSSELLANIRHTPRRTPIHSTRKIKAFITAGLQKPMNSYFCLKLVWIKVSVACNLKKKLIKIREKDTEGILNHSFILKILIGLLLCVSHCSSCQK